MPTPPDDETLPLRLETASEQLRLAAKALAALAGLIDAEDVVLLPHIDDAETAADELMRAGGRLAGDMGVSRAWGVDILFASPGPERPMRYAAPEDSIELDPLPLLSPLDLPFIPTATSRPAPRPWVPAVVEPTPPVAPPRVIESVDEGEG